MNFELDDRQIDTVYRIADAYKAGHRTIMVQAPTGFGKTILGVRLINGALNKPKVVQGIKRPQQICMSVPAISLINQTYEKLRVNDVREVGVIQANHPLTNLFMPVQVCSVQTLLARKMFMEFDLVLLDEIHIWFKYYEKWLPKLKEQGTLVIGLTATPWTKGLGKWFDHHIVAATMGELIGQRLCPFRVFNSPRKIKPDLSKVKLVAGEYHEGELSDVMQADPLVADAVQTWQELARGRPTLVFAVDRAHAAKLQEQYQDSGIRAGYIDMYTEIEERDRLGQQLKSGELDVVCNVDTLTIGVDWPWVSCVQLCRPTRSEMRYVQIIGRGLRSDEGKTDCLVLDHSTTTERLGFVDECYDRMTARGLDDGKKVQTKSAPPKDQQPKECPLCGRLRSPKVRKCPDCGFEPQPQSDQEFTNGRLQEATRNKAHKNALLSFDERERWYRGLLWVANDRRYSRGWAYHKYIAWTHGVAPSKNFDQTPAEPDPEVLSWVKSQQIRWAKSKRNAANAEGTLV